METNSVEGRASSAAASRSPTAPPFRPLARTPSASAWSAADVPLGGVYDLPEMETMTRLDRTLSHASCRPAKQPERNISSVGREARPPAPEAISSIDAPEATATVPVPPKEAVDEKGLPDEDTQTLSEDALYAKFSPRRKRLIVGMVAYCALLAPFASSSFLPSIPQIVDDLHTTASIVNVTVAIFILCMGIFPLIWAPYSGVYGRRPIYLLSLPIFAVGCVGTALSHSLAALILTRTIQAFGASPVLSIGAGTISDLYPKHERGTAMGLFYLGALVGPATAPAIAGILTEYVRPHGYGWRAMQWLLAGLGASAFILVLLVFPETAHSRGIDLIKEERAQARAARDADVQPSDDEKVAGEQEPTAGPTRRSWIRRRMEGFAWVWINPAAPIRLLLHPNIAAMSLNSSFTLMSTYTILVPLSQTVAPRYNITNSAILGCFYLAQGIGNAVATRYTGRYADWMLQRWLRKRNGVYVPEDRLYASLIGGGCILPLAVLALGWVLDKGTGKAGLAWVVILLFIDGIGLMCVLTPSNTYCVDVMPTRSSEVIAINNACRYALSAAASAFKRIGVGWTNTFAALVVWLGCGMVLVTIRFGARMRAYGEKLEGTHSAGNDLPARTPSTLVESGSDSGTRVEPSTPR
ncbi:hypothetical protein JCM10908_000839 [Rhodotorula pacifica]|uniref:MFS transporter n=1 Tax=Rhodotorula pacifica TaxID=1495444 RepID=UPI003170ED7E